MNINLTTESAEAMSTVEPDSPQPLQLTADSSRCTSPLSPPSDPHEASASSSVDEDNSTSLNLTMPSKSQNNSTNSNSLQPAKNGFPSTKSSSLSASQNHISNSDPSNVSRSNHKMRSDNPHIPSRKSSHNNSNNNKLSKSQVSEVAAFAADLSSIPNPLSPDLTQLLLEYRQVLLDILAKSIMSNETESGDSNKSVILPLKCHCGFNSKLSNQITRSSTYVHQLELRFRSLIESTRANEAKYTPKRPWYINSTSLASSLLGNKSSLLEKKSRQSPAGKAASSLFRSGNSSINSSVNGDEEDVDSDEDDVNDDNLPENLNTYADLNGGGKTILEGYLESLKSNLAASEQGSEEDDKDNDDEDDSTGPGKRIDPKTKKLVMQMQQNGNNFSNISRQMGISRKSVRRIVSNNKSYESRVATGMRELILRLYFQGRSYSQISAATSVSKPTIAKIVKQCADSDIFAKGHNGMVVQNGGGPISVQDLYADAIDDDDDEEKEMVVDEDAIDDDEDDMEDDEDNGNDEHPMKSEMDASMVAPSYPLQLTKPHIKPRKNMSLIQSGFNGYSNNAHRSPQQAHLSNSSMLHNNVSLIHQSSADRYKPYDVKMRHSTDLLNAAHRIPKSSQIVPNASKLFALQRQQQALRLANNSNPARGGGGGGGGDVHHRSMKVPKMGRQSTGDLSIKESIMVPEADKNNNTTLTNCNSITITSGAITNGSGASNSSNSSQASPGETNSLLPPIPASLTEANSDSEPSLVARANFVDGFPAGIMNSLNPNRATKLTLEDFNVVWQLRSQHWTHNQIRKYFEQRGKSISKSSISRIMNGKQRNFQQFFNVIPNSI